MKRDAKVNARMGIEIDLNECEIGLNECEHFLKVNLDRYIYIYENVKSILTL